MENYPFVCIFAVELQKQLLKQKCTRKEIKMQPIQEYI